MSKTSHLVALQESLSREKQRLEKAKTENEKNFRKQQIISKEKEIEWEFKALGITPASQLIEIDDLDLLAQLGL